MLGIMANREPITASLSNGEACYTKPDGEKIFFSLSGGMIDIENNTAEVLCEYALLPEEIDEKGERREAEDTRSRLRTEQSRRIICSRRSSFPTR